MKGGNAQITMEELKKIKKEIKSKKRHYEKEKKDLSLRGNSRAKYNCIICELGGILEQIEEIEQSYDKKKEQEQTV